ncbi:MAG TPA: AMP-binding protein [Paracoccaceae bacterium]|nr:AMP-binding protein [Paracoccaceae bacterium]
MNLSMGLAQVAARQPDAPAILWEGGSLSYGEFEDRVARIAGALRARVEAGGRIGMVMENGPEFLPVLFGIWRAGLTAIPVNARLHPREHAWILDNAEAGLCLASPALAEGLGDLAPCPVLSVPGEYWAELMAGPRVGAVDSPPDTPAWVFYTSGTTGRPKGAVLTFRNLLAMSWAYSADVERVGPDDIRLHAAPMTHGSGIYAIPFVLGGAQNLIPPPGFDPEEVFRVLARRRNVSFFAAPTMVARLVNHPAAPASDHPGLKTLEYGGAPMYMADLKRALEVFGPRLYQLYGQGEVPMTITHVTKAMHADAGHPRYWERLASSGCPRTGCEIAIIDDNWVVQPPGAEGEIATKSDCVMAGYLDNPQATAATIRKGWLRTGDVGVIDAEGFLHIKDRSKDLIISGGMNIYPREIEEVLLTDASVLECAVVGRPSDRWGEEVVAFVVAHEGAEIDPAALDRLCLDNLARFKRPKEWCVVDRLPKNNYGKILKTELRESLSREQEGKIA